MKLEQRCWQRPVSFYFYNDMSFNSMGFRLGLFSQKLIFRLKKFLDTF